jgi:hypothetical protein
MKVKELIVLRLMVSGLNTAAMEGGASTFRVAVLLAAPVPPSVEVTAPVVLAALPAAVPFTSTLKVQDVLRGTTAPVRVMTPAPAPAVTVPPQAFDTLGV